MCLSKEKYFNWTFQYFRILMLAYVFFQHFQLFYDHPLVSFLSGGGIAVSFFYILSGYLMAGNKSYFETPSYSAFLKLLWKKKHGYIFMYEIMLVLSVAYCLLAMKFTGELSISDILRSWFLDAVFLSGFTDSQSIISNAGWYFTVMTPIWVFSPFFYRISCSGDRRIRLLLALAVALLIWNIHSPLTGYYSFIPRAVEFTIGMMIRNGFDFNAASKIKMSFASISELFCIVLITPFVFQRSGIAGNSFLYSLINGLTISIFHFQRGAVSSILSENSVVRTLSRYTFTFYLFHYLILKYLSLSPLFQNPFLQILIVFICTWAIDTIRRKIPLLS